MGADPTTTLAPNGNHAQAAASETDQRILAELQRKQRVAELRAAGWKVELSGGKWAVLSDPDTIPERKVHPIKVAMLDSVQVNADGSQQPKPGATINGGYIVIAAFLTSWSLPTDLPTPQNVDPLMELPARDVSALASICSDLREEAFVDYSPSPAALADPNSPFAVGSA